MNKWVININWWFHKLLGEEGGISGKSLKSTYEKHFTKSLWKKTLIKSQNERFVGLWLRWTSAHCKDSLTACRTVAASDRWLSGLSSRQNVDTSDYWLSDYCHVGLSSKTWESPHPKLHPPKRYNSSYTCIRVLRGLCNQSRHDTTTNWRGQLLQNFKSGKDVSSDSFDTMLLRSHN